MLIARCRTGSGIPVLFAEWQNPLDESGSAAIVVGLVRREIKGSEVARSNTPGQVGQPCRIAVIGIPANFIPGSDTPEIAGNLVFEFSVSVVLPLRRGSPGK